MGKNEEAIEVVEGYFKTFEGETDANFDKVF